MTMTHYMELLAVNQPWNLIIFMAIPVILAETLAIAELYLLFTRNFDGIVHKISRLAGIIVGVYFLGIIVYLMFTAVVPITQTGTWRTIIDKIAVGTYLIAGLPLIWIALQELGMVNRKSDQLNKLKIHATCIAIFLIFGHIAMIAGMADPSLLGYQSEAQMEGMSGHEGHNSTMEMKSDTSVDAAKTN